MTTLSPEEAAAYADDARLPTAQGSDLLTRISATVREVVMAREHVAHCEEVLKAAQGAVRQLEEHALPELMREAGQERMRTTDGYDVELGEVLRASIPPASLGPAIMWLTANGQGAIVKREIKMSFGKGEDQRAAEAYDMAMRGGFHPDDRQSVHPQTLAAAIREMMANGVDVPLPLLGAYVQPTVKIKAAPPRRG